MLPASENQGYTEDMLRFFEALAQFPTSEETHAHLSATEDDHVYDLDAVIADVSTEAVLTDPTMLPLVEPPSWASPILADFVVPSEVMERASDLRDTGEMAVAEEWVDEIREMPLADQVGAVFARVDEHTGGLGERRRELVARWARETREERRTYRAIVVLAGWEDAPEGAQLVEKAGYDWLFAVRENGAHAGLDDLEVMGLDLRRAAPRERQLWEHYGTQLLIPFFHSFALLRCENTRVEAAAAPEALGPHYLRPVILPLWYAQASSGNDRGRWEIAEPTLRPGQGRFAWLDGADPLPEGLGAGLYWVEDRGHWDPGPERKLVG